MNWHDSNASTGWQWFRGWPMAQIIRGLVVVIVGLMPGACSEPDEFSVFRSAASKHFTPVAAHFALGAGVEKKIYPEMYIEYHGTSARLGVAYELESGPWSYVVVSTAGGHERHFGLHTIVEYREGSRRSFDELAEIDDLETQVRVLADLARRHASSLLEERTANLRELYLLSEKAVQEREREAGIDRTLHPRPALLQLFEACKPEQHAICAYHVVVDYNYSIDDVAAFLKVRREDVQRMIDQHDTIR